MYGVSKDGTAWFKEISSDDKIVKTTAFTPMINKNTLCNIKLHSSNSKVPTRADDEAAGYDLYSTENVKLLPGKRVLISTDISMEIPNNMYGRICPRSGLSYKNGIDTMAGVIDSSYRGIIYVLLINLDTEKEVDINIGDKIAQIVFHKYEKLEFNVTNNLNSTVRGDGGFGSSGK